MYVCTWIYIDTWGIDIWRYKTMCVDIYGARLCVWMYVDTHVAMSIGRCVGVYGVCVGGRCVGICVDLSILGIHIYVY